MDHNWVLPRRAILSGSATVLFVAVAGCTDADEPRGDDGETGTPTVASETVVETSHHERTVNYFEADRGDVFEVYVENGQGFRTHALVNGPENDILLSEGVEDEAQFAIELKTSGRYKATMTPHDESASTSGSMTVVLRKPVGTPTGTDDPDTPTDEPAAVVREWAEGRKDGIRDAQSSFESGLELYEQHEYSNAEAEFVDADEQFELLLDDAGRKANEHSRDSELYQMYGSVSYYFSKMRDSSRYYTFAVRLRQRGDGAEHSAYGKSGDADFWDSEADDSYETAQEARKRANDEITGIDL